VAGIDIGMLTFNEYHSAPFSSRLAVSLAFLVSSASCATLSLMIITVLSFRYTDVEQNFMSGRQDCDPAMERIVVVLNDRPVLVRQQISGWSTLHVQVPVVLLEWSILTFVVGLLLWYAALQGSSLVVVGLVASQVTLLWGYYAFLRWKQRNSIIVDRVVWDNLTRQREAENRAEHSGS